MKNAMNYLPKSLQKMVEKIETIEKVDYNKKTGKYDNRYIVYIKDGFIDIESPDNRTIEFNSIKFMIWKLKEDLVDRMEYEAIANCLDKRNITTD